MNNATQVRLDLARRNAERYAQNPNVQAILLVGSVSRGTADDYSDVDCSIYYAETPTEERYQILCEQAIASGGGIFGGTPEEGFALYEYVEGIRCDFGHATIAMMEKELQAMLDEPDVNEVNKQIVVSGFCDGIALYGEPWIQSWQAKFANYPPQLAERLVKKHLRFYPRWVLDKMGVERQDRLFLNESLLELSANILGVLYGINQVYPPGKLKGVAWSIGKMTIKPDDLLTRLESLLILDASEAVNQLYILVEETLTLLEAHMPEIDTSRTRKILTLEA